MSNIISVAAVARVLEAAGKSLESWPGTQFDMGRPEGRAMLGMSSHRLFPLSYFPVLFFPIVMSYASLEVGCP
jgi:hypothetical protein